MGLNVKNTTIVFNLKAKTKESPNGLRLLEVHFCYIHLLFKTMNMINRIKKGRRSIMQIRIIQI